MTHWIGWFAVAVVCLSGTVVRPAEVKLPAKDKFYLFLLMGQSNMAGRGPLPAKSEPADRRILVLNKKDEWAVAADPLHFDDVSAGVGPGLSFAKNLLRHENDAEVAIGLVPCAEGGTDLKLWEKDGRLFKKALLRAKIAAEHGTLKGVLWHQGENDASDEAAAQTYGRRLARMIGDFREAAKAQDLPFVVGKLSARHDQQPLGKLVNRALADLPDRVPHTASADSQGLQCKPDGIHFSTAGQIELGKRYGEQMSKLLRTR